MGKGGETVLWPGPPRPLPPKLVDAAAVAPKSAGEGLALTHANPPPSGFKRSLRERQAAAAVALMQAAGGARRMLARAAAGGGWGRRRFFVSFPPPPRPAPRGG